jgi:hypothetical protein
MPAPTPRRRGRTLAIRLAACAGVGAVATVGVAWGIVFWIPTKHVELQEWPARWSGPVPDEYPDRPAASYRARSWGRLKIREDLCESLGHRLDMFAFELHRAGWPAFALDASVVDCDRRLSGLPNYRRTTGIDFRSPVSPIGNGPGGVLPTSPVFPGFALDTAFYAAIALTLWSAPGLIRRRLRRARGRCPACGYDLKGNAGTACPECGAVREGVAEGRASAAQHTEEVPSASATA